MNTRPFSASPQPLGLGLMCKPPRPGTSKTRLAASVGHEAAAALSRAFLLDCAAACRRAAAAQGLATTAFYRPADAHEEMKTLLGPGWLPQFCDHGDLGATMLAALAALLRNTPAGAMIMGADIPLITPAEIAAAAQVLRQGHARSVVIIPSVDGGYSLIGTGCAEAAAPLFAPLLWSTPDVLSQTLARAEAAGLEVTLMTPQRDIDDQEDLDWLRTTLPERKEGAEATRAALARLASPETRP